MLRLIPFLILSMSATGFAQSGKDSSQTNLLAISQGISSPHITTGSILSNGYTKDNPAGAAYLSGFRTSFAADTGNGGTGAGLDLGLGDGIYGMSFGYRRPTCDGCDGFARGQVSANWGGFGLGIGATQDVFTVGMLLGANSLHRVGFVGEFDNDVGDLDRESLGLGYSYVNQSLTASLDASYSRRGQVHTAIVSPGIALRIRMISVSMTYDAYVRDDSQTLNDSGWFGFAYMYSNKCHLALYGDFVNTWTLTGSYFF